MKKFFTKNVWMLLCASVLFFGCTEDQDYGAAEFYAYPVVGASVEGATSVAVSKANMAITVGFDRVVDVTAVPLVLELEPGVTLASPASTAALDLTYSTSVVFNSNGRQVTYSVSSSFNVDTAEPIASFAASSGDVEANITIDNAMRTIMVSFYELADLSQVDVEYTFTNPDDITEAAPVAGVWDLSGTEPVPFSFKVRGMDVTYTVLSEFNYFTPANVPADWVRITEEIPLGMALYKVAEWEGQQVDAYVVAMDPTRVNLSTIGAGYSSLMTLTQYKADAPDANVIISGGDTPGLVVVDGVVLNNVTNPVDGNSGLAIDATGKVYWGNLTNRANGLAGNDPAATYSDDVYDYDSKANLNAVSAGTGGGGHLNAGAGGVIGGMSTDRGISTMMAANSNRSTIYFSMAKNATYDECAWMLLEIGATNGNPIQGNRDSFGLVVNGETLVGAAVEKGSGYAFVLK